MYYVISQVKISTTRLGTNVERLNVVTFIIQLYVDKFETILFGLGKI